MSKTNAKKVEQLGMPFGTACNKLRKMVLFRLLKQFGLDTCFHCSSPIETVDDLSMEHKVPWLDNDPELFWDLDNIAFSHVSCNYSAASRPTKKIGKGPEGTLWCGRCRSYLSENMFPKSYARECRECYSRRRFPHLWK